MNWFFIALIGPFLYAITNHIDKILLEKYFKEGGLARFLFFLHSLQFLALPFFFLADKTILDVSGIKILALAVVGILNVLVLWFYLLAIKEEEASVAMCSISLCRYSDTY